MRRRDFWLIGLGPEVGTIFWAMVFLEAAYGSYMGIWPLWIERLGAPVPIVGLVLGSSGLLRLVFLGPSAALGERFGTRRLILLARSAAGLGLLSAALATHWTQLFLMVLGAAVGELAFPLVQAHVASHAGSDRVRSFTLVFTVGPSIALFLSPLLAGLLVWQWGLRAAFVLAGISTLASIACFARIGAGRSRGARATRTAEPSSYRATFADVSVRRVLILQGATIFVLALGTSFIPTFLEDVRGMSAARIATLGAGAALGSTLFGLTVTRVRRLQRAPFVGVAIAVCGTAAGFLLFIGSSLPALVAIAFVLRGGLFSSWALFSAALGEVAPEGHRPRAFALGEMIAGSAFSFAPMVAGPLFALRAEAPLTVAFCLALVLVPLLLRAHGAAQRHGVSQPAIQPEAA
ncbi:MAG: MFS transporter [Chloroflexota bacterium]|nr:MFS transporter [Chloroflexota bacterium]